MKTYNDLLERVQNALNNDPHLRNSLSSTYVFVNDGTVILSGSVKNLALKKLAQKIVAEVPGVNKLIEDLHVEPTHDRVDVQIDWTKGKMALSY
jgi:osmotically-inducible protein OsmY